MDTIARVRAARGAVNMSLDDFAAAIGIGRQTLVRIESGKRTPRDHEYEAMAEVSGLPVGFFYAPDLDAVLDGHQEPTLRDRIVDLEAQVTELATGLAGVSADTARHTRELAEIRGKGRREERREEDG